MKHCFTLWNKYKKEVHKMKEMFEKISATGVIPVIKIDRVEDAVPLAQALVEGGLPCAEVTFRTAAAADAIKEMSKAYPEMELND